MIYRIDEITDTGCIDLFIGLFIGLFLVLILFIDNDVMFFVRRERTCGAVRLILLLRNRYTTSY